MIWIAVSIILPKSDAHTYFHLKRLANTYRCPVSANSFLTACVRFLLIIHSRIDDSSSQPRFSPIPHGGLYRYQWSQHCGPPVIWYAPPYVARADDQIPPSALRGVLCVHVAVILHLATWTVTGNLGNELSSNRAEGDRSAGRLGHVGHEVSQRPDCVKLISNFESLCIKPRTRPYMDSVAYSHRRAFKQ